MDKRTQIIIAGSVVFLILVGGGVFWMTRAKSAGYKFDKTSSSGYVFNKTSVTWNNALKNCAQKGMFLPSIGNKKEADALVKFLPSGVEKVWTSLLHVGTDDHSKLTNIYGGQPANYTPWIVKEGHKDPVSHKNGAYCVQAIVIPQEALARNNNTRLTIGDKDCNKLLPYVCAKSPV